jgi:hypothetical protein
MKVRICERWDMDLQLEDQEESFVRWVTKDPRQVSGHLTRGWAALQDVSEFYPPGSISSVVEYFGGMGAQARMVQEIFLPTQHTVMEYSPQACARMRKELPITVTVSQGDSYDPDNYRAADLVVVDFGDLTAFRLDQHDGVRSLLHFVFGSRPRAVVITDIAGPRLGLHRQRYSRILEDPCETYQDYLKALFRLFRQRYGYGLLKAYAHHWSTVATLVPLPTPRAAGPRPILPTPASPVGLEVLS